MAAQTNEIPLLELANEAWLSTLKEDPKSAHAIRARINREAATGANAIALHAATLIRTLNEAIDRLHAARTVKEAANAAAWLRCDTWDRMQHALARVEALASVLD